MDGSESRGLLRRMSDLFRRSGWLWCLMFVVGVCVAYRLAGPAQRVKAAGKAPGAAGPRKATGPARGNPVQRTSATAPADGAAMKAGQGDLQAPAKKPPLAAIVNNEPISREDLARECLLHYGTEVLETLVNRLLIQTSCEQQNIVVTKKEVDEEIDRMARKFSVGKDQWLKMLEKERGIKPDRYAQDIVWPTLALRELAKNQLTVTQAELDEAFESEFGASVKVRLIALDTAAEARKIHALAKAKPEDFSALAKKHSKDSNSASAYGLIQPIRRNSGDTKLEEVAFGLKKGEISPVVEVGKLFVFVKCEEHLPPRKGVSREEADPILKEALKDRKLRAAAGEVFKELQNKSKIVVAYGDPAKSQQMPGVAAQVNGQTITLLTLAEECIERHGKDVLEGTINRKLLDQLLRKRKLQVTDADIEAEIARAAQAMGKINGDGSPDVAGWLEFVTQNENITREVYVRDEVWPSAALKKVVGNKVPVTQEDLKRGYEANYGPKVRCRAIVVNNQRRAQEVWEKSRAALDLKDFNETLRVFGDLAEQYSMESGSRALRGEVPPIQKNGGQPKLEEEAFKLAKGELSGIVQVGDTYVILLCEGYTKPIDTSLQEVRDLLQRDIHEKKLRIAMARTFEELRENSRVDNFLAGTSKVPKREEEAAAAADPAVQQPQMMKR